MSDVKPVGYINNKHAMRMAGGKLACTNVYRDCIETQEESPLYSQETVTALQAEIEALRKDAERYKWLRSRMPGAAYRVEGIIYSQGGSGVDAGIDAAIAKEKQQESLK